MVFIDHAQVAQGAVTPIKPNLIQEEISLLDMGVIECLLSEESSVGSTSSLCNSKGMEGCIRAILDLKKLNKWMKKTKLQMETKVSTMSSLSQGAS